MPYSLVHDTRGLKVALEFLQALQATISDITPLLRIETFPAAAVELLKEVKDEEVVNEIDEGIANVCWILIIDREIEEIVFPLVIPVDLCQE